MTTRRRKSEAMRFMEKITGGPLTIGEILWALRKCDEIPQTTFAKNLGISKQHLCDIEKGRKFVTPARAALFAKKLGHPPAAVDIREFTLPSLTRPLWKWYLGHDIEEP